MAGEKLPKGKDTTGKTGGKNSGTLSIPPKGGQGTGKTVALPKKRTVKDPFKSGSCK